MPFLMPQVGCFSLYLFYGKGQFENQASESDH
jgi:hypothetical protein